MRESFYYGLSCLFIFNGLDMLKDTVFVSEEAAKRAVQLLQYLATGLEDSEEQQIQLNKLLCGVSDHSLIDGHIALTDMEKELSDELLKAVTNRWDKLKNTSIEGLRETFLIRAGKLNIHEGNYSLVVEHAPYDVLLTTIPWSFSVIRLPWMNSMLSVTWR